MNDMLDMSKLQAGVMEKNDTVYNLTESIESVLERYNKLKEQDGYCIHFEYDGKVQGKSKMNTRLSGNLQPDQQCDQLYRER